MIIDMTEEARSNTVLHDMVIIGCANTIEEVVKNKRPDGKHEVTMTINGVDVDVKRFCERWQENIHRSVAEEAKDMIQDKFYSVVDKIDELSESVREFGETIDKSIDEQAKALKFGENND